VVVQQRGVRHTFAVDIHAPRITSAGSFDIVVTSMNVLVSVWRKILSPPAPTATRSLRKS
jgi:hypothetical protein